MATDIFKLIFEHDLRMEQLSDEFDPRKELRRKSSLEEFMKPVQTYSKFYFTGANHDKSDFTFGFSALGSSEKLFGLFRNALGIHSVISNSDSGAESEGLSYSFLDKPNRTIVLCPSEPEAQAAASLFAREENEALFSESLSVREKISVMNPFLDIGCYVLFTEQAHNGTDLHLFTKENVYERFFEVYQPLTGGKDFRFFSINGKKAKSERLFYFETWSLDRSPHGFEEVFPETSLR
ncbi:MAG: hypothetical protein LAT84_13035 [Balneolia bacterium]|nr:hypothetical protein [Balneolia bacterium]